MVNSGGGNIVLIAPPQARFDLLTCTSLVACPAQNPSQSCLDLDSGLECDFGDSCGCIPSLLAGAIDQPCVDRNTCPDPATQGCYDRISAEPCAGTDPAACVCLPECDADADCSGPGDACFDVATKVHCGDGTGPCLCMKQDGSLWKSIMAHEIGHQVQGRAVGNRLGDRLGFCADPLDPNCPRTINDPPLIATQEPLCACAHVRASNATHCLQSIERTGGAQTEGFAHFFAARVWNKQDETNCTFVYYKEFLDETCIGGDCTEILGPGGTTLFSSPPPVPRDCATPRRWRNNHCNMGENADFGTEFDWLGFLYNLTSLGPEATQVSMTNLWNVYKNTCVPPGTPGSTNPPKCTTNIPMQWQLTAVPSDPLIACSAAAPCASATFSQCLDATVGSLAPCPVGGTCLCKQVRQGFVEGAIGTFGANSAQEQAVRDLGLTFGVDRNLAP